MTDSGIRLSEAAPRVETVIVTPDWGPGFFMAMRQSVYPEGSRIPRDVLRHCASSLVACKTRTL